MYLLLCGEAVGCEVYGILLSIYSHLHPHPHTQRNVIPLFGIFIFLVSFFFVPIHNVSCGIQRSLFYFMGY